MGFDLHTVDVKNGSTALSRGDSLTLGILTDYPISGPTGAMTGSIVTNPGSAYTSIPTVTGTTGTGGTLAASMRVAAYTAVATAGGTGHAIGDTVPFTGGTAAAQALAQVNTLQLASAAVNAAGTGYKVGDTIAAAGGTFTGTPLLTATHIQAISATVVGVGSGGTPGAVTLTGTTGTGTKCQFTGTIAANGTLTGSSLVLTVAGDYTANLTNSAVEPVTATASLTGATINVVLGVKTVTAAGGVYTVAPTSLTQGAGGTTTGTGATFNTVLYGIRDFALENLGSYSVLPTNPISQGSSSGSGTAATFTVGTWAVQSVAVSGGSGYPMGDPLVFSGGAGTGAAGNITTQPVGQPVEMAITSLSDLPAKYNVQATTNGGAWAAVSGKTTSGWAVTIYPLSGSVAVTASTVDMLVTA